MQQKIEAGAEFFQTQAVFEIDKFEQFYKKTEKLNVPVMAGVVILKSAQMAKFLNENVAGIHVPDDIISELSGVEKEKRIRKSCEISARLIKELKNMCQGIHIMSLGWEKHIPEVLDMAGL